MGKMVYFLELIGKEEKKKDDICLIFKWTIDYHKNKLLEINQLNKKRKFHRERPY